MKRAGVAILVVLVLGLGASVAQDRPRGFWAPDGYVAQADTIIRRGLLELVCAEQDSIVTHFAPGSPEEQFFTNSYLRADVRAFNASPDASRSPFLVEGCQLAGVDPWYHRIDLPFNRLPRWRGDVLFHFREQVATLTGGPEQELEVRHPGPGEPPGSGSATVPLDRAGARVSTSLLRLRRPAGPEILASAYFVGDRPVLVNSRDARSADRLRVNGFLSPPGRSTRLESGDWIHIGVGGDREGYTWLTELGEGARTASFVRVENDRVDRIYPAERLRPLLEPFAQAMDLALQSVPGAEAPDAPVAAMGVRLTVDRRLHDRLEAGLLEWCRENAHPTRPRSASLLVMDAFTGGVRAMPSCPGTAELAPYEPLSGRTRVRHLRNQNLLPHPVGSAAKPFWAAAVATTFPNFLDLQIGPHPAEPADSVLGCPLPAPYGDVHGSGDWVGLEEFIQRSCNRYLVEFASAALALGSGPGAVACREPRAPGAMATCFPPAALGAGGGAGPSGPGAGAAAAAGGGVGSARGTGAPVRFCGATPLRLALDPGLEAVGQSCSDLQLVHARFLPARALDGLTNTSTYGERTPDGDAPRAGGLDLPYRAGRYRLDAWGRVLDRLDAAGDTARGLATRLRFSAVAPQATNLALNTVEELRTDWVNLLLGGENSRWSNFSLAEAMARLMTGRAVTGELADSVAGDPSAPGAPAALPHDLLHPGVRRRVLHAMELVARSGGTAGALEPPARALRAALESAPGGPWDLWVFAKTGTPAVEKFVSSAQQQLVQRLYAGGAIRWDPQARRLHLAPEAETRVRRERGEGTLRWLREDVFGPLEQDPARFTQRVGEPLPDHPLYLTERGLLRSRELLDLRVERQGGVLLVGVLAVPRDAGRAAAAASPDWISACLTDGGLRRAILEVPPTPALDADRAVGATMAVFLDDLAPGQGSGLATALTARLLPVLGDHLLGEVRRRAGE